MSGIYLVKYSLVKNGVFSNLKAKNCAESPVFCHFCTFQVAWGHTLATLTTSTTAPCPGTPPANSRRTKQFLSHPLGL
jgi:hypothetical protein